MADKPVSNSVRLLLTAYFYLSHLLKTTKITATSIFGCSFGNSETSIWLLQRCRNLKGANKMATITKQADVKRAMTAGAVEIKTRPLAIVEEPVAITEAPSFADSINAIDLQINSATTMPMVRDALIKARATIIKNEIRDTHHHLKALRGLLPKRASTSKAK
jgi:hypothetical protein